MTIETRRADPTIGIASPTRTGFASRDLRQVLLKDVDDRFVRVSETRVESGSERFTASIEVMSFISDNYAQFRLTESAESNGKLSRIRSFKTDAPRSWAFSHRKLVLAPTTSFGSSAFIASAQKSLKPILPFMTTNRLTRKFESTEYSWAWDSTSIFNFRMLIDANKL